MISLDSIVISGMNRIIILLLACVMYSSVSFAQRYDSALGIRVGNAGGLTYQHRVSNRYTVEGMLLTDISSFTDVVAIGEYHGRILFQKRLNWYIGGGLHGGRSDDEGGTFGPALLIGAEMTIDRYNFSFDYLFMNYMLEHSDPYQHYVGLSARYILKKRKRKKINLKFWKWGKKK